MKLKLIIAAAALLASTPVFAKWSLVQDSTPVVVGGGKLKVIAARGWNRWSKQPTKQSELWSYDGPALNQIQFFDGLAEGQPMAKERNKKREPLPKFTQAMKGTDVAEAFEQTVRVTQGTPDFAIDRIEPARFAGAQGFRFLYHYTANELVRKGEARGAIVGGKLYMITYTAAALHYFDAHLAQAQAIMDSAKIG